MFDWIGDPNAWVALATLTALEIVLGDRQHHLHLDPGRPPARRQSATWRAGSACRFAMGTRIALLLSLAWIMRLTEPLFSVLGKDISGRDLILIGGGLFLLWKSVHEIHASLEGEDDAADAPGAAAAGGRRASPASWCRSRSSTSCSRSTR